jgi:3-phenylpropionate/trans-cinnamate dioxygenase ferredoxin reductase subunit
MKKIAIVGGGLAGCSVARRLRELEFSGEVAVFGNEGILPYDRPPLSKSCLAGSIEDADLEIYPASFYDEKNVSVLADKPVRKIDPKNKLLVFEDGEEAYDALVLATGARPKGLPPSLGSGMGGIHTLRTVSDARALAKAFASARQVLIVGGGYIGLEVAASAVRVGLNATLIEAAPRILQRVTGEPTSDYFRRLHTENGVRVLENTGLKGLFGEGHVQEVELTNGDRLAVDCVVAGIGIIPEVALAVDAGLNVDNGIVTNDFCQTSDPSIWAAGDCAAFPMGDCSLRLESVGNAIDMGERVAENIVGEPVAYRPKPWFWSDQYDTKLQIAGLATGYDDIFVRPGIKEASVSHWYYRGEQLIAVDVMNDPKTYMIAKRLIDLGRSPEPQLIVDPSVNLKALIRG